MLPLAVSVAAVEGDIVDAPLFPDEEAIVARAVVARKREFATGRACARRALADLGFSPRSVPAGSAGEPCWPSGVVGSITHCEGYRACAVASNSSFLAIGIDAERNRPVTDRVLAAVASEKEMTMVCRLDRLDGEISWTALLFSAKEAVFKALFPLTRRRFGFAAAEVRLEPHAGRFSADLQDGVASARLPRRVDGNWMLADGVLLTAIALERP